MPEKVYAFTGDWQKFSVPAKVEWVDVTLDGAGSGRSRGGRVTGRIRVKGVKTLHILVGERGREGGGRTLGGGGVAGLGANGADGWSGGGASIIRTNSKTGPLRAVAGGAGGISGDGGEGGAGGGDVGGAGFHARNYPGGTRDGDVWFYDTVGIATGGTEIQGGNGGTSSLADRVNGEGASDALLSRGGRAGDGDHGGGGGGGGYHGGGGGQGSLIDRTPGGGGGGGSSYVGGLTGYTNTQGGGSTGNGVVAIAWVSPAPANQPPAPPTEVKLSGRDYSAEMATHSTGGITITAKVGDPNSAKVKMVVYYSPNASFKQSKVEVSDFIKRGKRASVRLTGLAENTMWYARVYSRDAAGLLSTNYTALKFWTNRRPDPPALQSPGENATVSSLESPVFTWNHIDPDHPQQADQRAFKLQWRRAATATSRAGDWLEVQFVSKDETYVGEHEVFKASNTYEWRVRTQDEHKTWGAWSPIRSFYVSGATAPPNPISPVQAEAVDFASPVTFTWRFRDPNEGASQRSADIRYRPVGSTDWTTIPGDSLVPGPIESRTLVLDAVLPGHYEWQVRTLSTAQDTPSPWSDTENFYVVPTPGDTLEAVVPDVVSPESRLGCGNNEVYIYRRGGRVLVGQIKAIAELQWTRKRDDISVCTLTFDGSVNASLLRDVHCWVHEVVVFRDGVRVWEGPITRQTDSPDGYSIEAKDVMAYVYRRIMRQGYNDTYRVVNNVQVGQMTVVQRARQIIMNALAPDDPNVLGYLTSFDFPDDALQSRAVPDFSKMAWEEVDDMAATAGLDYTTIGRRIMLWDTHRPIGRLLEMRTEHFDTPPVVSEYGMLLATDFAVTNNAGIYGVASRRDLDVPAYGIVELLASAFGETEGGGDSETVTSEARTNLELSLTTQAERSIASRFPTPMIVRVPDSSALAADTPVLINHLVPGVWIPLRAQGTVREASQWQKLDVVQVNQDARGERVLVTMSPAPNGGEDPDADTAVEAEA